MSSLTRFGVAMPSGMLRLFDALVVTRGNFRNRSYAIRDIAVGAIEGAARSLTGVELRYDRARHTLELPPKTKESLPEVRVDVPAIEERLFRSALAAALDCEDDPSVVIAALMRRDDPGAAVAFAWHLIANTTDDELRAAWRGLVAAAAA
jgi:Arc/MetJ-type ribon-helix-helix transcriptional regulator